MKLIVTHKSPDLDAVTSVWLLKRFYAQKAADAKLAFVPAGTNITDEQLQELQVDRSEVVTVDTGLGEFDHHQPDRGQLRICAASLVYDWLCEQHPDLKNDWALKEIVEQTIDEDHFGSYFWPEPTNSRYVYRLSEILHGLEMTHLHDDESQLFFAMRALDGVYAQLHERDVAQQEIEEHGVRFETRWGRSISVLSSNQAVLKLAQIQGFNLVIIKDPRYGHVRIKAAPLPEIDLTPLADKVMAADKVGTWFFHAGKHMLLNASMSNPSHIASPLTLEQLQKLAQEA